MPGKAPCPSDDVLRRSIDPDDPMPTSERSWIEEHVDYCDQGCKQILSEALRSNILLLTPNPTAATVAQAARNAGRDAPPPVVPGYDIQEELGRGGMGVVYKARQLALDRVVALKMLLRPADEAEAEDHARFAREAHAIASLNHPGIVHVYELGRHEGRSFIGMELVEGGSLARHLGGRPQPAREAATAVAMLAEAVQVAHEHRIIHRDLKPANILRARDGTLKITDFGLARRLDVESTASIGLFQGTASYAAPEQAGAPVGAVGPATDVYGLGAILYEMVTGRPPFRAGTTWETLQQVVGSEPVAPRYLAAVPRDLETICLKCLAKEPARRYASAQALADDLRRFLTGDPIRARPTGWAERALKWAQRRPTAAGMVALTVLLLFVLTLAGMSLLYSDRLAEERDLAKKAETRALGEKARAEGAVTEAQKQKEIADALRKEAEGLRDRIDYAKSVLLAQRESEAGHYARSAEILESCRWDLRGWEWGNLRRTVPLIHTLHGHRDRVQSVCFSPDGERLASASLDKTVRVWDVRFGRALLTLKGHAIGVRGVSFSPDGRLLASGGEDAVVRLWEMPTGRPLQVLTGHTKLIRTVCFSPDGQTLASASYDGTVRLWQTSTGKLVRTLEGHTGGVWSVCWSPDGQRLASAGEDATVRLWNARSGEELRILRGHTDGGIGTVQFSPDGDCLASAGDDRTVRLWDAATGRELRILRGHANYVNCVCFSGDGRDLATTGADRTLRLWDVRTGQQLSILQGHSGEVRGLAWSPDGQRLAAGDWDNTVRLWDARIGRERLALKAHTDYLDRVAFDPTGQVLASSGSGAEDPLRLWNGRTGQPLHTLQGNLCSHHGPAFSSDGRLLASARHDGTLLLWEVQTGKCLHVLQGHTGKLMSFCFSPDGQQLASCGADHTIQLWEARTGKKLRIFVGHTDTVLRVCFSPDGQRLASRGADGTVRLWDTGAAQSRGILLGHTGTANWVEFSPDGRLLTSYGKDGTVQIWETGLGYPAVVFRPAGWATCVSPDGRRLANSDFADLRLSDTRTGEEQLVLKGHVGTVRSVCFSPDGQRLASAGEDRMVRLWDVQTGQELRTLEGATDWVIRVGFSPDGKRLASCGRDAVVRLWDARHGQVTRSLAVDAGTIASVGLSTDGLRIVACTSRSDAGTRSDAVLAWSAATGQLLKSCTDPPPPPDQRQATTPDGRLTIWINGNHVQVLREADFENAIRDDHALGQEWYLHRAQEAETAQDWFAAAFHLMRLSMAELEYGRNRKPPDGLLFSERGVLIPMAQRGLESQQKDGRYLGALGAALYAVGEYRQAVVVLTQAVKHEQSGGSPEVRLLLALAHRRLGNNEEARQWRSQAIAALETDEPNCPLGHFRKLLDREAEAVFGGRPEAEH